MPETTIAPRKARRLTTQALTEASISLSELNWRLLHWLLRYPLQRVDDLVVGVARWASRATVYRHMQRLEEEGLVESVLPKTPGLGKRLYHLSNPGLHVLAQHLGIPARDLAQRFQADEAGLLRLLPRLPTLLLLQDAVNGLIMHAADAITNEGRRPRLVRWTWQRDMTHRFLSRDQPKRFFVDGTLALCLRTQQGDGSMLEQWYGLFLLSTELDDERLMRQRLERLLCWRESPERWSVYQHMLPVVILAHSPRQRDHWQRAVEMAAKRIRLEPLVGALVCLPHAKSTHVNPWLLTWRTLGTDLSCHMQALLRPLPRTAFPSSLTLEEVQDEHERKPHTSQERAGLSPSTDKPVRLSRLIVGNLERRAASLVPDQAVEQENIALLGLRLTPCQWSILHLLLNHPLLSDQELAAFLMVQRKSVRSLVYTLHRLGCLEGSRTEAGTRWYLGERGMRLLSLANHLHVRNLAVFTGDETGTERPTMKQRGVDWLLQHIQHTAGIYSFFATLTEAAQREPGHALCWWETGAMCERRYRVGEQWYNLRPDALAEYHLASRQIRFWLEWDRGTMNVRDLAIKFASYAKYIASREWARERSTLPRLFCVAPDVAQERRIQRVAQAGLTYTHGVEVWTATEVLLNEHGPLAPIWSRGIPLSGQVVSSSGSLRQRVFVMLSEKEVM